MNTRPSISFVLPMFNERDGIHRAVDTVRLLAVKLTDDYEIVVVDDASTDGCGDIVEAMAARADDIRFHRLRRNTRFGGAFAKGFKVAVKDLVVYIDSDIPARPDDILASVLSMGDAGVVTACSNVAKGDSARRRLMSYIYNLTVRCLFGLDLHDINSGCKIVRRELVEDLEFVSTSPLVDVELFLHARRKGATVKQFPLVFVPRSSGRSYISRLPVVLATLRDMLKVKVRSMRVRR